MGKGGGKTQTVLNETKLPGWVDQAGQNNYAMAQQIAGQPYQPYTGNMLAGWNTGQQQGYNAAVNGGGVGQQAQNQAQNFATQAGQYQPQQVQAQGYNPAMQGVMNTAAANAGPAASWNVMNTAAANAGNAQQMGPAQMLRGQVGNVAAWQLPGADMSPYLNPYTSNVIDTTMQQLGRQNDILQNQSNAKASAAGAFGGSRQAIMNAENNRGFMDTAARTTAGLNQANFSQAQQAMQTDQNRVLQADLANQGQDWNVANANLGNWQASNLQNMLAGNQMAQFNASNQQTALNQTAAAHNSAAAQQAENANQMAQYNAGLQQQAGAATSAAHNAALANQAAAINSAGQFNSDIALKAQLANQQAGQGAVNSQLQAANALSDIGGDQQQRYLAAAQAQMNAGNALQAQQQLGLDQQYQQWQAAQNYPTQQLNILQSGLTQTPYGKSTAEVSPYYQNTGANMLSGGLGGAMLGSQLGGGLAGWAGVGGGAGALLGLLCWVARAAYGADNPRWLDFRNWMLREAPVPLYRAYLRHGPAFARYLSGKPRLRRLVRGVMESILRASSMLRG